MKRCKRKDVPVGAIFVLEAHKDKQLLNLGQRRLDGRIQLTSMEASGTSTDIKHGEDETPCLIISSPNESVVQDDISFPEISYRLFRGDNCDEEATAYMNEMLVEGWILERVQTMPEPLLIEVLMKNDAKI